jgi:ABC-2 type transport system permease protein
MNNIVQAIYVEMLKTRRSRMPLFTALGFALFPLACSFFMIVLKDPELARRFGLISTKARILAGTADWPTYLKLIAQATAGGGMVLFSLISSWVFGREYSDRTIKDILALPTSRSAIVVAKFIVVMVWSVALTVLICLLSLCAGAAVGLSQASLQILFEGGSTIALSACLSIALVTPIAFFASAGHGYLPPMGFMFLALLLAQVIAAAGWGEYFPWAIPGVYSQGEDLGIVSYLITIFTSITGIVGTIFWWEFADQTQ